jgi:hypothetical protein
LILYILDTVLVDTSENEADREIYESTCGYHPHGKRDAAADSQAGIATAHGDTNDSRKYQHFHKGAKADDPSGASLVTLWPNYKCSKNAAQQNGEEACEGNGDNDFGAGKRITWACTRMEYMPYNRQDTSKAHQRENTGERKTKH